MISTFAVMPGFSSRLGLTTVISMGKRTIVCPELDCVVLLLEAGAMRVTRPWKCRPASASA